ncbi:MAG: hypothetical protein KAS66_11155 [Candidatus Omnitrophica bacterium]|nr:hypothetical protein [Candidatus Omnitrophota bacterium]
MTKLERSTSQSEMFSLISRWQESGLSQIDFCQQHDLVPHRFYYWLKKYKQSGTTSIRSSFLQVEVETGGSETSDEIRIEYPNGVIVTVGETVHISRLRALIRAV